MRSTARVVIVGGGAMGCSLLYHLSKLGWTDTVLIEKNELTAGSTWHAAGLCTHFAHNLTIMHMRAYSVKLYSEILERETGQPVSFHQTGALRMTRSQDRMDEFRHVQGIGKFAGFDFNILTPQELKDIYPLTTTDNIIGSIHEPLDGHVDPSQATRAMAAGARANGASIERHREVTGISKTTGNEWLVQTTSGEIRAEHIVNAAGTWAFEVGRMLGLDLPVVPILHQYVVTDAVDELQSLSDELPIIRDPEESWYVRQEGKGFIIGPYESNGKTWSIDKVPPEFGMELLPPDLDAIEPIMLNAMQRIPALANAGIKTTVHGPITFTPDAGPLIGPAFDLDNAWLLTGSSMGVMEGGGAGKFLAEWMVGGEPPMDPLAVDSRRFGDFANRDFRIVKAVESFGNQFAIHYPFEERSAGRNKRLTPINKSLSECGAVFGTTYGWERPNWFADDQHPNNDTLSFRRCNWFENIGTECRNVRDNVGIADMSIFAKFKVSGEDAQTFMQTLGANTPPQKIGAIKLIHVLTTSGGVHSEFTVTRVSENSYYLTSAAAAERLDCTLLVNHAEDLDDINVSCVTKQIGVLAVMGPRSRELLEQICDGDLSFPWFTAKEISIAGVKLKALRVCYVGEFGYELHHPIHLQQRLFDALRKEGSKFDCGLFGAFAMNAMRLEKGYRAWGMDFTTERTPIESGIENLVKAGNRKFTGREALINHGARPNQKRMVLLEIMGDGPDPFYSHPVFLNDKVIGIITSGAYGHRTQKILALAYLDAEYTHTQNNGLAVEILGEKSQAIVLYRPPYDPDNKRMRGIET